MNSELMDSIYNGHVTLFYIEINRGARADYAWSTNQIYAENYYRLLTKRYEPDEDDIISYPLIQIHIFDPKYHGDYLDELFSYKNEIITFPSHHDILYNIALPLMEFNYLKTYVRKDIYHKFTDAASVIHLSSIFVRDNSMTEILLNTPFGAAYDKFDFIKWLVITNAKYVRLGYRLNEEYIEGDD